MTLAKILTNTLEKILVQVIHVILASADCIPWYTVKEKKLGSVEEELAIKRKSWVVKRRFWAMLKRLNEDYFRDWNYGKHARFCTAVYLGLYAFDMTVSYFIIKKMLKKFGL